MAGSSAECLKAQGNEMFARGKLDAAIEAYSEAICFGPKTAVLYTNRALCHFKKKNWAQAASDSAAALEIENSSIKGLYLLGAAKVEQGEFDDGIQLLDRSLALCKQQTVSYKEDIRRAMLSARKKQWEGRRGADEWQLGRCQQLLPELLQQAANAAQSSDQLGEVQLLREGYTEALAALRARREPSEVPDHFCCKISMDLMLDPVTTPSGVTYERSCLREHLQRVGNFDPVNRAPLVMEQVYPNLALREVIDQYLLENPWAYQSTV